MTINEEKKIRGIIREWVDEYVSDYFNNASEEKKKESDSDDDGKPGHESEQTKGHIAHMRTVVITALKNKYTDCAPYFYYLWPDKDKANARSYGIKCRDGELNDNGDPYSFSDSEIVKLYSKLSTTDVKPGK